MTKHEAMFNWIKTYPKINSLMHFNFMEAKIDNTAFRVLSEERKKVDILGVETVEYKFGISEYKNYTNDPYSSENLESLEEVDEFIDWVTEQNIAKNYPNIHNAKVDNIKAIRTGTGIETLDPLSRLAQYLFIVIVTYEKQEVF